MYSIETIESVYFLPHKPKVYKGNVILGTPVYAPNVYELKIKSIRTHWSDPYEEVFEAIYLNKFAKEVTIPEHKIEAIIELTKNEDLLDCIDGVPVFPTEEHLWDWLAKDRPGLMSQWLEEANNPPLFANIFGIFKKYDEQYCEEHIDPILNHVYVRDYKEL